jgi:hypothetical protein
MEFLDYRKQLREERSKEDCDIMKVMYYKWKLGIMPVQKTEINTYFDRMERYYHSVNVSVCEIECKTFDEYLKSVDLPDIIINKHIFN